MNGYQQCVGDGLESGTFGSERKTSILKWSIPPNQGLYFHFCINLLNVISLLFFKSNNCKEHHEQIRAQCVFDFLEYLTINYHEERVNVYKKSYQAEFESHICQEYTLIYIMFQIFDRVKKTQSLKYVFSPETNTKFYFIQFCSKYTI